MYKAQVNVVTLRNGRELEEVPEKKKYIARPEGELVPKPFEENKKEKPEILTRPPSPFPQRLQKQKDDVVYKKFLDILSQVRVNLPLVEILQEVPQYAKFLRDIMENKQRLTEECNTSVQSKLPPKLKDPVCFIIPLSLGKQEIGRGLSLVMPDGIIEDVLVQLGKFILPTDFIVLDYVVDEEVAMGDHSWLLVKSLLMLGKGS
ncbi:uncharacterized protein [Nicotiana sylvestris]|uniref:uncharacterized protein n=1 Tax=Nicotiana sylvestris TaxID=4096 RepID=UPI00388CD621